MANVIKNQTDLLAQFAAGAVNLQDFRNFVVSTISPVVTAGVIDYWNATAPVQVLYGICSAYFCADGPSAGSIAAAQFILNDTGVNKEVVFAHASTAGDFYDGVTYYNVQICTATYALDVTGPAIFRGVVTLTGGIKQTQRCETAATVTEVTGDCTIVCNRATAVTVNLLAAETGGIGRILYIKNIGAGAVAATPNGTDTIDGESSQTVNQWECLTIQAAEISGTPTYGWIIL